MTDHLGTVFYKPFPQKEISAFRDVVAMQASIWPMKEVILPPPHPNSSVPFLPKKNTMPSLSILLFAAFVEMVLILTVSSCVEASNQKCQRLICQL